MIIKVKSFEFLPSHAFIDFVVSFLFSTFSVDPLFSFLKRVRVRPLATPRNVIDKPRVL